MNLMFTKTMNKNRAKVHPDSISATELSKLGYCPRRVLAPKTTLSNSDKIRVAQGNREHQEFEDAVKIFRTAPVSTGRPSTPNSNQAPLNKTPYTMWVFLIILIIVGISIYLTRPTI